MSSVTTFSPVTVRGGQAVVDEPPSATAAAALGDPNQVDRWCQSPRAQGAARPQPSARAPSAEQLAVALDGLGVVDHDGERWRLRSRIQPPSTVRIGFAPESEPDKLYEAAGLSCDNLYGDASRLCLQVHHEYVPKPRSGLLGAAYRALEPLVPNGSVLSVIEVRETCANEIGPRFANAVVWDGAWQPFTDWLISDDPLAERMLAAMRVWTASDFPKDGRAALKWSPRTDGLLQFVLQFFVPQGRVRAKGGFLVKNRTFDREGDLYFEKTQLDRFIPGLKLRRELLAALSDWPDKSVLPGFAQLFDRRTLEALGYDVTSDRDGVLIAGSPGCDAP